MNKHLVTCIISAVAGGALVEIWRSAGPIHSLAAQEPRLSVQQTPPSSNSSRLAPQQPSSLQPARSAARPADRAVTLPVDNSLTPEEQVNVAVYENVNRSVVNIDTTTVRNGAFLIFDIEIPAEGAGSGSVLDKQGHVLTNFHVIDAARTIKVTLFDGSIHDGRLVGKDESNDVAVIKIDAPADVLFPVVFGDSTHLRVGQRVFAIGNPFGLERTLTTGIVSSVNRSLPARNHRTIKSIIQTDAAINPGSSGGPLLDSHGRLIGMNAAIATSTGQSAGVGFAIPVANIARIVPQLIERGKVIRSDAGITRVQETERGLLIATLAPGGPAERAGLRGFRVVKQTRKPSPFSVQSQSIDRTVADLIVAVNGEKATNVDDFLSLIESQPPGQEVVITVIREGREVHVPLRLAAADS